MIKRTRIKLSDYSGHKRYYRQSATVINSDKEVALIQFCDDSKQYVQSNLLVPVHVRKLTLPEYKNRVKLGDWVRTNGDGAIKEEMYIEGQVGEIGSYYDEITEKDKEAIFIWQNRFEGNVGKKRPNIKGFDYGWLVYLDNSEASIEVIGGKLEGKRFRCNN